MAVAHPKNAARKAAPWIEKAARLGYLAKGFVYALIGTLAFAAATGMGGRAEDKEGIINTIADQPFGFVLLAAIGIGLFGYALWRVIEAVMNTQHRKPIKRVAYIVTALAYGSVGWAAFRAIAGEKHASGDKSSASTTASLMQSQWGQWLVVAIGLIFIIVGVVQIYNGFSGKYMSVLRENEMSSEEKATARAAGMLGLNARGVVFTIIGGFLCYAVFTDNAKQARGIAGALKAVFASAYGPWLLGIVGFGLIAYGVLMFVEAKYRRMDSVEG